MITNKSIVMNGSVRFTAIAVLMDLAQQFHVPLEKRIPALAIIESDGTLGAIQKNGEFEKARAMNPEALVEFLNKWKPGAR